MNSAKSPFNLVVPDDLAERDQWILWRRETSDGRETKVPYSVGGHKASSTNALDWAGLENARQVWSRNPQRYAGLGFAFSSEDPFVGIDLDDCLEADGTPKQWASRIIERFADTYIEISPSGQGLKIWAKGRLPASVPGVQVGDGQIEMYDRSRYFTFTGRTFRGEILQIEDHSADVLLLYERLVGQNLRRWPLQPLKGGRIPYGRQHNTLIYPSPGHFEPGMFVTRRSRLACKSLTNASVSGPDRALTLARSSAVRGSGEQRDESILLCSRHGMATQCLQRERPLEAGLASSSPND